MFNGGILHIPADNEHPRTLRIPSTHLKEPRVDPRTGEKKEVPVYYSFVAGRPTVVNDEKDYKAFLDLTYRKGRVTYPLFKSGAPEDRDGPATTRSLLKQVQFLMARQSQLEEELRGVRGGEGTVAGEVKGDL